MLFRATVVSISYRKLLNSTMKLGDVLRNAENFKPEWP